MKYPIPIFVLLWVLAGFALFAVSARAAPDDPTIVGGDPVPDPNPYVWQVSLQEAGSHICGGSVIADKWILTAAHCVVQELSEGEIADLCSLENLGYLRENFQVAVGVRALSTTTAENLFRVTRCIAHPQYDPAAFFNDIAVIELATPVPNANAYIVPLLLNADENALATPGTWATLSGWGNMVPGNNQSSPDILMALDMPLVAQQSCRAAWATVGVTILDSMVCAGFVEGGKSACQDDSGGALIVADGYGNYLQHGIVSFGPGSCAEPTRVPVYTRVSAYIAWLEQSTGIDLSTYRAPDLVADQIETTATGNLAVVISNQGTARVALDQGFWVDLYINPQANPTQVNQTWNFLGSFGAAWGVDETGFVLLPGMSVTLELGDSVYWPTLSNLPLTQIGDQRLFVITPETEFYVQVDSANADTDYGAILETHELFNEPYNNIVGPLTFDEEILIPIISAANLPYRLYLPLVVDPQQRTQVVGAAAAPTPKLLPDRPRQLGEE